MRKHRGAAAAGHSPASPAAAPLPPNTARTPRSGPRPVIETVASFRGDAFGPLTGGGYDIDGGGLISQVGSGTFVPAPTMTVTPSSKGGGGALLGRMISPRASIVSGIPAVPSRRASLAHGSLQPAGSMVHPGGIGGRKRSTAGTGYGSVHDGMRRRASRAARAQGGAAASFSTGGGGRRRTSKAPSKKLWSLDFFFMVARAIATFLGPVHRMRRAAIVAQRRKRAAFVIQCAFRRFVARRRIRHLEAAIRIASNLKAKLTRGVQRRHDSATVIQARIRGYLTRRQLERRLRLQWIGSFEGAVKRKMNVVRAKRELMRRREYLDARHFLLSEFMVGYHRIAREEKMAWAKITSCDVAIEMAKRYYRREVDEVLKAADGRWDEIYEDHCLLVAAKQQLEAEHVVTEENLTRALRALNQQATMSSEIFAPASETNNASPVDTAETMRLDTTNPVSGTTTLATRPPRASSDGSAATGNSPSHLRGTTAPASSAGGGSSSGTGSPMGPGGRGRSGSYSAARGSRPPLPPRPPADGNAASRSSSTRPRLSTSGGSVTHPAAAGPMLDSDGGSSDSTDLDSDVDNEEPQPVEVSVTEVRAASSAARLNSQRKRSSTASKARDRSPPQDSEAPSTPKTPPAVHETPEPAGLDGPAVGANVDGTVLPPLRLSETPQTSTIASTPTAADTAVPAPRSPTPPRPPPALQKEESEVHVPGLSFSATSSPRNPSGAAEASTRSAIIPTETSPGLLTPNRTPERSRSPADGQLALGVNTRSSSLDASSASAAATQGEAYLSPRAREAIQRFVNELQTPTNASMGSAPSGLFSVASANLQSFASSSAFASRISPRKMGSSMSFRAQFSIRTNEVDGGGEEGLADAMLVDGLGFAYARIIETSESLGRQELRRQQTMAFSRLRDNFEWSVYLINNAGTVHPVFLPLLFDIFPRWAAKRAVELFQAEQAGRQRIIDQYVTVPVRPPWDPTRLRVMAEAPSITRPRAARARGVTEAPVDDRSGGGGGTANDKKPQPLSRDRFQSMFRPSAGDASTPQNDSGNSTTNNMPMSMRKFSLSSHSSMAYSERSSDAWDAEEHAASMFGEVEGDLNDDVGERRKHRRFSHAAGALSVMGHPLDESQSAVSLTNRRRSSVAPSLLPQLNASNATLRAGNGGDAGTPMTTAGEGARRRSLFSSVQLSSSTHSTALNYSAMGGGDFDQPSSPGSPRRQSSAALRGSVGFAPTRPSVVGVSGAATSASRALRRSTKVMATVDGGAMLRRKTKTADYDANAVARPVLKKENTLGQVSSLNTTSSPDANIALASVPSEDPVVSNPASSPLGGGGKKKKAVAFGV